MFTSILKRFACGLGTFVLTSFAMNSQAAIAGSAPGIPTQPFTYMQYGDGDIILRPSPTTGINECDGFWLRPSDPGFYTNYALLLYAMKNQTQTLVYAETTAKWNGSSIPFCLVYALHFQ